MLRSSWRGLGGLSGSTYLGPKQGIHAETGSLLGPGDGESFACLPFIHNVTFLAIRDEEEEGTLGCLFCFVSAFGLQAAGGLGDRMASLHTTGLLRARSYRTVYRILTTIRSIWW